MISGTTSSRAAATILVLSAAMLHGPAASAASVSVTVNNIRDGHGHVRIGVCDRSEFLGERCRYHAIVPSRTGSLSVVIPGVAAGTYAVVAYQDATDVGHLRRSFLGIPKDGLGVSRDPPARFGPPSFDQCALAIGRDDAAVTVVLHYF